MKNALTEVELELMNILWRLKEGSVNDVLAELPQSRKLAYTSVSTILRILEQKKVLTTRKEGRGHVYVPKLSKTDYEASALKNIVNKVFDGTPVAMVRQLLDTNDLTKDDLKELHKLLAERLGNK